VFAYFLDRHRDEGTAEYWLSCGNMSRKISAMFDREVCVFGVLTV